MPHFTDEDLLRARELAREVLRIMHSKGGKQNTARQKQARLENLKRARWARYHKGEPYPGHNR